MIVVSTAILLFAIGVYGILSKRDLLRIVISVAIMLGSITLLAVSLGEGALPQSIVLFVWAIEIAEIVIGVAVFLYIARSGRSLQDLQEMKW